MEIRPMDAFGRDKRDDIHYAFNFRSAVPWKLDKSLFLDIINRAISIRVPERILKFNKFRDGTGYVGVKGSLIDFINITGDIYPDLDDPCPLKSVEAILAHEYYGHRENSPSILPANKWRDEAHASITAFYCTEGIVTNDHRLELIDDVIYKIRFGRSELEFHSYDIDQYLELKIAEDLERESYAFQYETERSGFYERWQA